MKKLFLLIFAVLLVLGSALPLAAYRVTRAVLGHTAPLPAASSVPELPASQPNALPSADAETFPVEDQSAGKVVQLSRREYVLGAVAAEMPVSWPDEALKAQAVAAHTYALYCRDHAALQSGAWLTVDPARRQGCLTEPVLRSYWGTAYEQNYARLSALVDEVLNDLLFYDNAPACTSYFAISNGRTEASENVWGTALPYLIPVDSGTDLSADNYQYTAVFSAAQVQQAEGVVSEVESYISDAMVYAPVDGEVSTIIAEQGELVGTGYPVVAILDTTDTWVTFNIKETLLPKITVGMKMTAYVPALDRNVELEVTYISVQADFATWSATRTQGSFDIRTFAVKARPVTDVENIRPGMSVLVNWDELGK